MQDETKLTTKKPFFIVIGIILVLLISAGTLMALILTRGDNGLGSGVKVAESLSALSDKLKSSVGASSDVSVRTEATTSPSEVLKQYKDKAWVMVDDGSEVLSFSAVRGDEAASRGDYSRVTKALEQAGLVEVNATTASASTYSPTVATAKFYSSDFIVCNLRSAPDKFSGKISAYSLEVSCANQDGFSKNTDALFSFADAYNAAKLNDKDVALSTPNTYNGGTEGYSYARLNVSTLDSSAISTGLFFKKADSSWVYFTTASDLDKIACAEYKTDDAKKAFVGFTCVDEKGASSFVKVADPKFEIAPGVIGG